MKKFLWDDLKYLIPERILIFTVLDYIGDAIFSQQANLKNISILNICKYICIYIIVLLIKT